MVSATDSRLQEARRDALARSRFVAGMGHTLRTPMNGVVGYAELLLEEAFGPLNDRQRGHVHRIIEAGRRELELIDDLVVLARLQAGDVELATEPVSLRELIQATVAASNDRARSAGLTLTTHLGAEDHTIDGDAEQLGHALRNIVGNALRYSEAGGTVHVRLSGEGNGAGPEAVEDWPAIQVSDEGPGIAPGDRELVLGDPQDAEGLALRRERRWGLGLPVARGILELHGGRIQVESNEEAGQGSRIRIMLPRAEPLEGAS